MRIVMWLIAATLVVPLRLSTAASAGWEPHILFAGDRDCGDNEQDCAFANVVPGYPYLHLVLHDAPANRDWHVQEAEQCGGPLADIGGGIPTDAGGWLEAVINVSAWQAVPRCYVLRGGRHYLMTYHAAYFDSMPQPDSETVFPGYRLLAGQPALPDLDVTYIHRMPAIRYDSAPNLPRTGQQVMFEGHVVNAGTRTAPPFSFVWLLDGAPLRRGWSAALDPGQERVFRLPWRWLPSPHTVSLEVVPGSNDYSATNDRVTIQTTALMLGFWVEQSAYTYFHEFQWSYCATLSCSGSNSLADWLQRQVAAWNSLLGRSAYPHLAPYGIADRVAVDAIHVVPDGSLPLHGGGATYSPDLQDHTVDLEWGLPARGVETAYKHRWDGSFNIDWSMIHELNHARSLADLYRFDIPDVPGNHIDVRTAAGASAFDPANPAAPLHLFEGGDHQTFVYRNQEQDLMSCPCTPTYSAYSALVWNRIRERRPVCGNTNPPCNLGNWFREVPPVSVVRVLDPSGASAPPGSTLTLYWDTGQSYTGHSFDMDHRQVLTLMNGEARLPADPFHTGGDAGRQGHNVLLLEVRTPEHDVFCFQEPTALNLAYWEGYRDLAHPAVFSLTLETQAQNACGLNLPPARIDEPFGASPYTSGAVWKRQRTASVLTVTVRDDGAVPLSGREVEAVSDRGRVLATGLTDRRGEAVLHVAGQRGAVTAIDLTDNRLPIPLQPAGHSRTVDRRP